MKKRMVTIIVATLFALGSGMAAAQSRGGGGGGGHGGGAWSGGGQGGGGSWSGGGGGAWRGGGGSWNGGGGNWHGGGGSWSGGGNWHGGSWNNGWRGGCWNCGWRGGWNGGTNVGFFFGFPGTWWWPGFAPGWGWGWGWPVNTVQVVGAPGFVDQGAVVFIQRDQPVDGAYTSAPPARTAPANEYWHYCIDPPGFFPQVQQCNREWLKVVPNVNSRPAQAPQYQ